MRASIVAAAAVLMGGCAPIGNVTTQRMNNYRNGAYLLENALTPGNVHTGSFGRLYTRKVDGQQLANPLMVKDVMVGGAQKTLFFVATAKNCLYAFDLKDTGPDSPLAGQDDHCNTSAKAIWWRDMGDSSDAAICDETMPHKVGITSTPVIDDVNGFMYVTSYQNNVHKHFIYKVNIATGATVASREMTGSASGKTFNPLCHRQRPGLLLQGGVVYAGFGTFTCDNWCPNNEPYRGWVLGFQASDLTPAGAYTTAPTGGQAGIWQAGSGLIGDGTAIYFLTGNELEPTPLGDSFVKIVPGGPSGLMDAGHFTPSNHHRLACGDTDLGAGAATYIPDGAKILGGGKEGKLYLVDASMPGTAEQEWQAFFNTWHDNSANPVCDLRPRCLGTSDNVFAKLPQNGCFVPHDNYQDSEQWSPNIHSAPIYWKSAASPDWAYTYLMPEKEHLKLYRYNLTTHQMETTPAHTTVERNVDGMPGAALWLSASFNTNGIVWANIPNGDGQWGCCVPGHLVAYNAEDLSELYRDDDPVAFAKFNPPVAANGYVIRPTFADQVIVYGVLDAAKIQAVLKERALQVRKPPFPLPDPAPLVCYSIPQKLEAYGGAGTWKVRAETAPAADQVGKVQSFVIQEAIEGGCSKDSTLKTVDVPISIYWSPETCAHPIRDPFLGYWTQLGAEKGQLGYPVTDEVWRPDGTREQMFERGSLVWSAEKGVSVRSSR